jgi:hypothetical protein
MFSNFFKSLSLYFYNKKQHKNRGFSLVVVTATGAAATLATASLLMRTTTLTSSSTTILTDGHQNLGIAIAAKTRLQALLIENSQLIEIDQNEKEWEQYLESPNTSEESRNFNHSLRLCKKEDDWKQKKQHILDFSQHKNFDLPMGEFSLTNLEKIDSNQLKATIETQNKQNKQNNKRQYELDIKLSENYLSNSVPVLWFTGKKYKKEFGKSKINGNLWANDCKFPLDNVSLVDPEINQAKYTGIKMPEVTALEVIEESLPESYHLKLEDDQKKSHLKSENKEKEEEEITSLTLPREEDQGTRKEGNKIVYEYLITDTDTIDSLTINSGLDNESMIILYIVGDINISEIIHNCESSSNCSPENLIIVAYEGSKMCLQFDKLDALIVAPNYELGMKSKNTTSEVAKFRGSAWIDHLSDTEGCGNDTIEFNEALQWQDLPTQFQSITPTPKHIEVTLKEEEQMNVE